MLPLISEDEIIAAVRTALVDDSTVVRGAAAQAFDAMQHILGPRAIDETVPSLLQALRQPGPASIAALAALKEVLRVRAEKVTDKILPVLLAPPITAFNAHALSSLVPIAGHAAVRRLPTIIDALEQARENEQDEKTQVEMGDAIKLIFASVNELEGLNIMMMHLLGLAKAAAPEHRASGCRLLATFCSTATIDIDAYAVDWIRQLIPLFSEFIAAESQCLRPDTWKLRRSSA